MQEPREFFTVNDDAVWPTDQQLTKDKLVEYVQKGGSKIKEGAMTITKDINISEEDVKETITKASDIAEEEVKYLAPDVAETFRKSTERLNAKPQLISGVSNALLFYTLGGLVLYALIKKI